MPCTTVSRGLFTMGRGKWDTHLLMTRCYTRNELKRFVSTLQTSVKFQVQLCDSKSGCEGTPDFKAKPIPGARLGPHMPKMPANQGGPLQSTKQTFGVSVTQTDKPFKTLPFDGILGLPPGRGGIAGRWLDHALTSTGGKGARVFGVYLSNDTALPGSVSFGGVESNYIDQGSGAPHSGEVTWHPASDSTDSWAVQMVDLAVDGHRLGVCADQPDGLCPAMVDTGSSLLTGPSSKVGALLDRVPLDYHCGNLSSLPKVDVILRDSHGKDVSYPLMPKDYVVQFQKPGAGGGPPVTVSSLAAAPAPPEGKTCELGLGKLDIGPSDGGSEEGPWILGNTFLRRYYSIYDDDAHRVGLVRALHRDEAVGVISRSSMGGLWVPLLLPRYRRLLTPEAREFL